MGHPEGHAGEIGVDVAAWGVPPWPFKLKSHTACLTRHCFYRDFGASAHGDVSIHNANAPHDAFHDPHRDHPVDVPLLR